MPPMDDDNYTVQCYEETSTIDFEYLNHDATEKSEKFALHGERCSVCSANITNEEMLDYIVHGHKTKDNNTNVVCACDNHNEDYNMITAMIKKDNGYHSGSSESLRSENNPYILENDAFHTNTLISMSKPVQKESHLDNEIEVEIHVHSVHPQTVDFLLSSVIKSQYQSIYTQKTDSKQKSHSLDKATNSQHTLLAFEVPEEISKLPAIFKKDNFPYNNSNSCSATEEGKGGDDVSKVNYSNSSVITSLESSHNVQENLTGINNAVSMGLTKQTTLSTSSSNSFPYVDEDKLCYSRYHYSTSINE